MGHHLVLASASARRKQLLRQIGVHDFEVTPADIDESAFPNERPTQLVSRLAQGKASAVHAPNQFTLGADTIVTMGRRVFDKTECPSMAKNHLEALSGRAHTVITAICLIGPMGQQTLKNVSSKVIFKRLDAWEVEAYLAGGEWRGKAGAYAIQAMGGAFVKRISGSYSAIVGLPLCETRNALIGMGYAMVAPEQDPA